MNDYVASAHQSRRGIHSIAIAIDHDAAWSLATAMLTYIRQYHKVSKPMIVSDGDLPLEITDIDVDARRVAINDLAINVANNSHDDRIAFVIAYGETACNAAIKECERVILAVDANKGLACGLGERTSMIAEHRRPIVAFMHEQSIQNRKRMRDDHVCCVPVRFEPDGSGQMHLAKLDPNTVHRVRRALMGVRIGLALGGGGARGISHIGVLEVFARHGVVFDSLAGTSAGSIIGAAYAAGFSPTEIGDFFRNEMIPPRIMSWRPILKRVHLFWSFRGTRFETKLRRYMQNLRFDQLAVPLSISTVDLMSGNQVVRRDGDLVNAVLQSINHPVFGAPIVSGKEILVDGGVLINVPASVLRAEGCDYVVSVDVGSSLDPNFAVGKDGSLKRPSYIATLLRTMDIGRRHSSELHRDESDLIIFPETADFDIEDFHAVDPLIEVGRRAGEAHLAAVEELIQSIDNA